MRRCRACLNWNHRDRPTCKLCGAMLPAVALVMLVLALTGCVSADSDGRFTIDSGRVQDGFGRVLDTVSGAEVYEWQLRAPKGWRGRALVEVYGPGGMPERVETSVKVDQYVPTGGE